MQLCRFWPQNCNFAGSDPKTCNFASSDPSLWIIPKPRCWKSNRSTSGRYFVADVEVSCERPSSACCLQGQVQSRSSCITEMHKVSLQDGSQHCGRHNVVGLPCVHMCRLAQAVGKYPAGLIYLVAKELGVPFNKAIYEKPLPVKPMATIDLQPNLWSPTSTETVSVQLSGGLPIQSTQQHRHRKLPNGGMEFEKSQGTTSNMSSECSRMVGVITFCPNKTNPMCWLQQFFRVRSCKVACFGVKTCKKP